jgi:hypothetical protein
VWVHAPEASSFFIPHSAFDILHSGFPVRKQTEMSKEE